MMRALRPWRDRVGSAVILQLLGSAEPHCSHPQRDYEVE
jgi:hypothetical protein